MYYVSKEMMTQLNTAKLKKTPHTLLHDMLDETCGEFNQISYWYFNSDELSAEEAQAKIIQHVFLNDPQFEEEKTKKYIVQSKETDRNGYYWTLCETDFGVYTFGVFLDTYKFDTREEAEKWTNPQTELVEVED